jgi:hypothetical protein
MTSLFGSTYVGEQFVLKMKVVKHKSINLLDDRRLESCFPAATPHVCSDTENLVAKKQ